MSSASRYDGASMPGTVTYFFRGLSLQVSIGVLAAEKAAPQRILIDFEYDCRDMSALNDEIASVLDYDSVRREVAAIAQKGHFNLQETLCREILASLLAHPQVIRAKVEVRKPDIYADVDAVGVRMEAGKS
jgi:7,8-dihydroneopterin aldolase/epimerase/oxygenase